MSGRRLPTRLPASQIWDSSMRNGEKMFMRMRFTTRAPTRTSPSSSSRLSHGGGDDVSTHCTKIAPQSAMSPVPITRPMG